MIVNFELKGSEGCGVDDTNAVVLVGGEVEDGDGGVGAVTLSGGNGGAIAAFGLLASLITLSTRGR